MYFGLCYAWPPISDVELSRLANKVENSRLTLLFFNIRLGLLDSIAGN